MKPINNKIFFEVEVGKETEVDLGGGVKIEIVSERADQKYDDQIVTQKGIVWALPPNNKMDVEEGDLVYTHHFLTKDRNKVEFTGKNNIFRDVYENCFCKIEDGEPVMLNDWNLFIIHEAEGWKSNFIINPKAEPVEDRATAAYLSKSALDLGVKPGDTVIFPKRCSYKLKIWEQNITYYRVETKNLMSVIN